MPTLYMLGKGALVFYKHLYSSIIITLEIIGEDFIFASLCSREFTRK